MREKRLYKFSIDEARKNKLYAVGICIYTGCTHYNSLSDIQTHIHIMFLFKVIVFLLIVSIMGKLLKMFQLLYTIYK